MPMTDRPKTYAEFMALPMCGYCLATDDGIVDTIGAATMDHSNEANDLNMVYEHGWNEDRCWTLGRRADGSWCRVEVL